MQTCRVICAAAMAGVLFAGILFAKILSADESITITNTIADADFEKLHTLVKPQPGESRWMEIDWYPNVWEARKKAAAEGRPIFLMAGSGGAPAAGC